MFLHLGEWTVAEALLRNGAAYSPPELPEGDRYRLVGLRVAEVVERFAGRRETAESVLRDARDLALGLNLPLQVAELEAAVTAHL
jgi:hypothetical protein